MRIHGLSAEQSLANLKTTAAGLTAAEAAHRLGRGQAGGRGLQVGEGLLGAETMDPH